MDRQIISCCMIILFVSLIKAEDKSTNHSEEESHRRKSGRVVKLYSSLRPEPILCTNEGFQSDPRDCAVFYRCMKSGNGKYSVFRFQCGPGTVYDPETEVCNHPQNTKRSECGGFMKPMDQPNINDIDGEVHELPSPITTIRPVYTEKSSTYQSTSSIPPTIISSSGSAYGNPLSTSILTQSPSTLTSSSTTSNEIQHPLYEILQETTTNRIGSRPPTLSTAASDSQKDKCTSDGFMGDSQNCRKFYRCVGNHRGTFTRYEFSCSESTIWDDDLQSCNHLWAVKRSRCGRNNLNTPTNINQNEYSLTNIPVNIKENEKVLHNLPASDQPQYSSSQTQKNETVFTENLIQFDQKPISTTFTSTTNLQTSTDKGQNSMVSQTFMQPLNNTSLHNNQPAIQINESNLNNVSHKQDIVVLEQALPTTNLTSGKNICNKSGFMRDQYDCKRFYRCVENGKGSYTKYEYSCGEGTLWDSKMESCNHAWAVKDCNSASSTESLSQNSVTPSTVILLSTTILANTPHSTTYLPSNVPIIDKNEPEEDSGYGRPQVQQTSTPFSSTISEKPAGTEYLDRIECVSDGFIGDKNDCNFFYRCIHNGNGKYTKIKFKCGDGTVWDPEIGACNHQWAVKNCGSTISADFNKTESTIRTTTPLGYTSSSPTFVNTTPEETENFIDYDSAYGITTRKPIYTTTTKPSTGLHQENTSVENCKQSGFTSNPNDCTKFYRCISNENGSYTRHEFTCSQGTVWDPKIEACNHAWAVQSCSERNISISHPVTVSTTTLPTFNSESTSSSITSPSSHKDPNYSTSPSTITSVIYVTTVHTISGQCNSSGFIGDSKDCKKFYRCVDNGDGSFTKHEFQCGQGTIWDQKIEACNHEWAVEKCGSNTQGDNSTQYNTSSLKPVNNDEQFVTSGYPVHNEPILSETNTVQTTLITQSTDLDTNNTCVKSGFMADKNDCTKFYRCVDDAKGTYIIYAFVCGEGTVWDPTIEACNHAWAVKKCGSGDTSVTESTTQNFTSTIIAGDTVTHYTTGKVTSSATISASTTISADTSINLQPILQTNCELEGFYGNPNDCKKFYRCVNDGKSGFIKFEFTCGDGTFWNNEIQACDHEYNTNKCSQNLTPTSTDKFTSAVSTSTSPSSILSTFGQEEHTTQTVGISPEAGSFKCLSDGFFANPFDCRKFSRCVDNGKGGYIKYDFTCGEGTIWVQEIQACDHDDEFEKCKMQISTTESIVIAENIASSTENTQHISSTTVTTTLQVSLPQGDEYQTEKESVAPTNENCIADGYHGAKDNCKKFYRCVDNGHNGFTKYEFTCGEGTAWDDTIKACNHASQVTSCQNTNESNNDSKPAHDGDNAQQLTTSESSTTTERVKPTESTQSTSINNNDSCQSEGYYGNTYDCKKFYRCVHDGKGGFVKYEYTCGDGTIWDQDITTCNHPNDVSNPTCVQNHGNTQSSNSTSTSSPSNSTTDTPESNQGNSYNCSKEESTSKPQNNNITCEKAGYHPDPNDCKKFYRCVDWDGNGTKYSVYHFTCGEGTIWDPVVETCNHEESVYPPRDCNGSQSQSDNTTQGSTTTESALTQETTTIENTSTTTTKEPDSTTTYQSSSTTSTTTSQQTKPTDQSTSEQTTQQANTKPSTSEQTTISQEATEATDNGTTNEPTTTQKESSCEQTTQQSTSEKTTQKTSTTEPTTQESTTSEQTTTQKSSTSEQTMTTDNTSPTTQTTHEPSTSETTTMHMTSTDEQTTQASTASQTTQQSTSEQTTQQSTSSQQTTTDQTTINQTTQSESNTEPTTISSTTEQQATSEQTTSGTTGEPLTTEQSTDGTTMTDQSTTEETSTDNKECPEIENEQYLLVCPTSFKRHHKYCNMFYQCTEEDDNHEVKIAMFTCPNNTIYDETKIQCVEPNKAEKQCEGQMAKIRKEKQLGNVVKEPIIVGKYSQICPNVGHYPFERNAECSPAFLKCTKNKSGILKGYVYQCPEGYVYWSISRRCELKRNVRDCQLSRNDWRNRWEIPIDSSNIAS